MLVSLLRASVSQRAPRLLQVAAFRRAGMGESIVSVKEVAATKWLRLNTITYKDHTQKERLWDVCERTTRNAALSADAVVIFAVLRSVHAPPATLLVRQFRPPMGSHTLELPAGLLDEGETAATAALRELKEETGYTASVRSVSRTACMSPGLTNETVQLVTGALFCLLLASCLHLNANATQLAFSGRGFGRGGKRGHAAAVRR